MYDEKEKLIDDIEKRLKTIMIGSISRFENTFGYLWNHGEDIDTDQHEFFRRKWDDLRNDLLNHGNNQIRLAVDSMYDFFDNKDNKYKYSYKFSFKNNKE